MPKWVVGRVFESYRGNNITLFPQKKFTSKLSGDLSLFYSKAVAILWFGTIFYPRTSPAHNHPTSGVYHARDVICSQSNETVRGSGSGNANPTMLTPCPRLLAFRPTFLGSWLVITHSRIQTSFQWWRVLYLPLRFRVSIWGASAAL